LRYVPSKLNNAYISKSSLVQLVFLVIDLKSSAHA